jgi:hypothetical protein
MMSRNPSAVRFHRQSPSSPNSDDDVNAKVAAMNSQTATCGGFSGVVMPPR